MNLLNLFRKLVRLFQCLAIPFFFKKYIFKNVSCYYTTSYKNNWAPELFYRLPMLDLLGKQRWTL